MKRYILAACAASILVSCSEKTTASFTVLRDKAEARLAAAAGEAEVAVELYRNQYASLKERLVRMKTVQHLLREQLDEAYASSNERRISLIENQLKYLNEKIPDAEKALRDFFDIYQNQRIELLHIKEEIAIYKTTGMLSDTLSVTSDYERRADNIKQLTSSLKEKAKRAQSLLEVGKFEETYTTR